jgi:phage terminase small subunit
MGPLSKQDVQNMLDSCRSQMVQRLAAKQDIQQIQDIVKTMLGAVQQNQQILRQAEYQRSQLTRRAIALEARIAQLEQEIHSSKEAMNRMAANYAQPPQVVVTPPANGRQQGQYVYRPA